MAVQDGAELNGGEGYVPQPQAPDEQPQDEERTASGPCNCEQEGNDNEP